MSQSKGTQKPKLKKHQPKRILDFYALFREFKSSETLPKIKYCKTSAKAKKPNFNLISLASSK